MRDDAIEAGDSGVLCEYERVVAVAASASPAFQTLDRIMRQFDGNFSLGGLYPAYALWTR